MSPIKAHRLTTFCKHLLLITSLWMPVQPVWAEVAALSQQEIAVARPKKRSARNRQVQRSFLQNCLIIARGVGRGGKTLYEIISDEVKGRIRELKKDLRHVDYVRTPLPQLAAGAYAKGPEHAESSIIDQNEIDELLVPDLLQHLSEHTITAVGAQAMTDMILLHDKRNTLTIQQSIRHLVENDEAFEKVQSVLQDFAKHQRAFYRYWDPNRAVSVLGKVHLFEKAKELYVVELARWLSNTLPLIGKQVFSPITNKLEKIKNPYFLGANADVKIAAKFFKVLIFFGLRPVYSDLYSAIVNATDLDDPLVTAWDGIATAFNAYNVFTHSRHFPQFKQAQIGVQQAHDDLQNFYLQAAVPDAGARAALDGPAKRAQIWALDIFAQETNTAWKARHDFLNQQKEQAKFLVQGYGNRVEEKGTLRDLLPQTGDRQIDSEWHLGKIGRMISAVTSIVPADLCYGNFRADGTLIFNLDNPGVMPGFVPVTVKALCLLQLALVRTANITLMIKDGVQEGIRLVQSMKDFKLHTLFLARSLRSISRMHTYLVGDDYFKQTRMAGYLEDVFAHTKSKSFRSLIELAHAPAFSKEKSKDVHRGHALALHPYMQENSGKLQKALWAIGELDAVYAIAKLMREHRESDQPFCFVGFLPEGSEHAQARIEKGTLLMVPNSKPNSMTLGYDDANKAILSGPNGAGKSVCIKMFGCNVVLAHAFGIAAAERMELHWLTKLCTSIDTSESVADEMSRFQAQKARMDSVLNAIEYYNREYPQARFMFLTDEPLSGTTPNLAAMYMNEMCEKMRLLPQLVSIMATHNEAPTKFEGNGFVNYQVCVETYRNGLCKPSFRVAPGIPEWWFRSDEQAQRQQKSFADYTTTLKLKDKLEKELEQWRRAAEKTDDIIKHKRYPDEVSVREARTYFRAKKEKIERAILQVRDELGHTCDVLERLEGEA